LRVEGGTQDAGEHVDFVPSYSISQFFRWNGYVMEITQPKTHNHVPAVPPPMYGQDDFIDDAQWGVNRRFRNMGVLTLKYIWFLMWYIKLLIVLALGYTHVTRRLFTTL